MFQLKKDVMDTIKGLNNDWVEAIKTGAETGEGIDMSDMFGKFSEHMAKLDEQFNEAAQRIKGKKGGFFG
jgi:hypothetical protein